MRLPSPCRTQHIRPHGALADSESGLFRRARRRRSALTHHAGGALRGPTMARAVRADPRVRLGIIGPAAGSLPDARTPCGGSDNGAGTWAVLPAASAGFIIGQARPGAPSGWQAQKRWEVAARCSGAVRDLAAGMNRPATLWRAPWGIESQPSCPAPSNPFPSCGSAFGPGAMHQRSGARGGAHQGRMRSAPPVPSGTHQVRASTLQSSTSRGKKGLLGEMACYLRVVARKEFHRDRVHQEAGPRK